MKKKKKKRPMTRASVVAVCVFAAPFLLWGLWSTKKLVGVVLEARAMESWVEVPATIEEVELVSHNTGGGGGRRSSRRSTMWKVDARYTYQFDGQSFKGERVGLHTGSSGDREYHAAVHDELKRHFDEGRRFRCFVNPAAPEDAVLYRELRPKLLALFAIHAVLFSGVGIVLIGSAFYSWRQQQRRPREVDASD